MPINVRDLGARGDGATLDTVAIQAALDQAAAEGGGQALLPPGCYRSGTLRLRDRVDLHLRTGAVLLASPDIRDYPDQGWGREGDCNNHSLIVARDVQGASITGHGVIDGNGPAFWEPVASDRVWIPFKNPRVSPLIEINGCADVRLSDFQIRNSPGWTVHLFVCDRVWIRGLRIDNHLFGPNTDGLDINGCHDVMISDCHISASDDAIVLKTHAGARSCERITATNCVIRTHCVAFKCGTESFHDFRQIVFSNSVVYRSTRAFGLYCFDGGTMEDIVVSNVVCDTDTGFILNRPVHLDLRKRDERSRAGLIRNVAISHLIARTDGRLMLTAADGGRIERVTLSDIQLRYPLVDTPDARAANSRSTQFSSHSPEARLAPAAIVADGVDRLVVRDLAIDWPRDDRPPRDWMIADCENGSARQFDPAQALQGVNRPTHVLWARRCRGGYVDAPQVEPYKDASAYDLDGCTITVRA